MGEIQKYYNNFGIKSKNLISFSDSNPHNGVSERLFHRVPNDHSLIFCASHNVGNGHNVANTHLAVAIDVGLL